MSRSLILTILPAVFGIASAASAQSSIVVVGDGHDIQVVEQGPGTQTVLGIDARNARVDITSTQGSRTWVYGHGEAPRIGILNASGDLTVFAGACPEPLTPRLVQGIGTGIIVCN